MSVGTTASIVAGVGAAGSLANGLIGANAAGNAANTQANAASQTQQLQAQEAQQALATQQQQLGVQQNNLAPYQAAGTGALTKLENTGPFTAPTAAQAAATPGYQFQLQQGELAAQNSAAANGDLLSGGFQKSLQNYAQGLASTNYQNVYNNALQTYGTNQNAQLNLADIGQNATNSANQASQNYANQAANINLATGAQQGQDINNAAAARASGYVGQANAATGAIGGATNALGQGILLQTIQGNQNNAGNNPGYLPVNNGVSSQLPLPTNVATPASGGIDNSLLQNPFNATGYAPIQ